MEDNSARPAQSRLQFLGAIVIGISTVALSEVIISIKTGMWVDLHEEFISLTVNILMVAAPFFIIAFSHSRSAVPWLVGVAMTALFWGYYVYDVLSSLGSHEGVDIGLALAGLVYPFAVAAAIGAVIALQKRIYQRNLRKL